MKHAFYWLCLALMFSAGYARADNYKISGTWADGNGQTVYLCQVMADGKSVVVDSAVVKDGAFEMTGTFKQINRRVLAVGNDRVDILLDGQPIQVNVAEQQNSWAKMYGSKYDLRVTGSREQAVFAQWRKDGERVFRMSKMYNNMIESELNDISKSMKENLNQQAEAFIDSCRDSHAFAFIIGDYAESYEEAERLYNELTPGVKKSYAGKLLAKRMKGLRDETIGKPAPEIELAAPDGTMVKLSSLRGKYVLIDFWASWCGPCLREAPNVKAVYEKYKEQGFEVYGVSLDKDKAAWEKAIKEHGLSWIHVSSLKGWKCPAAQAYGVKGIPTMFLIDKKGRFIAKNLRGQALRDKVASLFE